MQRLEDTIEGLNLEKGDVVAEIADVEVIDIPFEDDVYNVTIRYFEASILFIIGRCFEISAQG